MKYADEPLILNVEMKDFIHDGSTVNRPNNAQEIYLKELGSESPMLVHLIMKSLHKEEIYLKELGSESPMLVHLIMKSLHKEDKRKVKHIGCKRFGITSRSRLWTRRWRSVPPCRSRCCSRSAPTTTPSV